MARVQDRLEQKESEQAGALEDAADAVNGLHEREIWEHNRLLASIALASGAGLFIALPFALRAGSAFFLPVTTALVIAITLVPFLEWLERRGLPSPIAALIALSSFLVFANTALVVIVVPAVDWIAQLPSRIARIKSTLAPVIDLYAQAQRFIDELLRLVTTVRSGGPGAGFEAPGSLLQVLASAAPSVAVNMLFAVLVIFFALSGWTRLRRRAIKGRGSFTGALTIARGDPERRRRDVALRVDDRRDQRRARPHRCGRVIAYRHAYPVHVGGDCRLAQFHSLFWPDHSLFVACPWWIDDV